MNIILESSPESEDMREPKLGSQEVARSNGGRSMEENIGRALAEQGQIVQELEKLSVRKRGFLQRA